MLRLCILILFTLGVILPFHFYDIAQKQKKDVKQITQFTNFKSNFISNHRLSWFESDTLDETSLNVWQAQNPKLQSKYSNGEQNNIKANSGKFDQKKHIVELFDKVLGNSTDQSLSNISTNYMMIINKEQFYTKGPTRITNENQIMTGDDFNFDKTKNKFIIPKQGQLVYNR